ncbi:acyl-CoA desaturase [Acidiferrimicrobium sp. IK]|uniref:acyl-CoA desaturase n=1 Tax=Acidiferrimicrobium sp. IK TaxID=2871700 RepID=UPI0021CB118A|nr:acyl-CoA desaturase [Acidiferrimicrobium sp. IK]MCU4186030.1 acyl-CoA desaturase [Acidiferrimicrobium sp. IK]
MTTTETLTAPDELEPLGSEGPVAVKQSWEQVALALFIVVPFLAVLAAVPVLWGWGLGWHDVVIAIAMYWFTGHGVTIGFHRAFTHRSFRAKRWLKVLLAIAGSMSIEGPVIQWVADHRKHHRFTDRDGDPHSPWRYGSNLRALTKGFFHAHMGWLFDLEQTSHQKYAPDMLKDQDIVKVNASFKWLVVASMLIPPVIGGLWAWSWAGALTAFFWGSLVRVSLLHHVTFSINSVCHVTGRKPFKTKDKSGNVWWLALPSMGESWHNLHHAEPSAARHGVLRGQIDTSARLIWLFEKLKWVSHVRWPDRRALAARAREAVQPPAPAPSAA